MDILQKIAELDKLNEVAQGLMLVCELPQVQFATFQFIQSRPDQHTSPFVRTTYPAQWLTIIFNIISFAVTQSYVIRSTVKNPFFGLKLSSRTMKL